jgi:hypothetical protein
VAWCCERVSVPFGAGILQAFCRRFPTVSGTANLHKTCFPQRYALHIRRYLVLFCILPSDREEAWHAGSRRFFLRTCCVCGLQSSVHPKGSHNTICSSCCLFLARVLKQCYGTRSAFDTECSSWCWACCGCLYRSSPAPLSDASAIV